MNNQDILWSILEFLNPYCPDHTRDSRDALERKQRIKALCWLARTCQSFKDPALTLLWSELDDLRGIISLIGRESQVCERTRYLKPIIDCHAQTSDTSMGIVVYYTTKVKRLRYTGDISRKDISKMTFFRRLCETRSPFPNLRHLEVICWPLSLSECSFLFGPMLERLTLVGVQPTYKSRTRRGRNGPWSNRHYQRICIYQLIKKSPRLKSIHSLVPYRIDVPRERPILPSSLANGVIAKEPNSRPGWLIKVMRVERLCNSHLFALSLWRCIYCIIWIVLIIEQMRHRYGMYIVHGSSIYLTRF